MVGLIAVESKLRLAIVLHKEGKWQEAEEMNREVLEVTGRVLGEELARHLKFHGRLGWQDRKDWHFRCSLEGDSHSGRLRDAIHKLRTSIAALSPRVDDEHPDLCGFGSIVGSDE